MSNTTERPISRRSRFTFAIAATALLVLASAATVAATGPDTPVGSGTTPPGPGGGDGATRVYPNPTVTNLHRSSWDHIRVSANGKKLTVYFWMGLQDCNGLGRVDVSRHDGQLKIKLWTGTPAGSENQVCPEIAQFYKTVVHLDRPIIGGNAS